MRHEFNFNGDRYAVEVPDHLWNTTPSQQALDSQHAKDRGAEKFVADNLTKLESLASAALVKGGSFLWCGQAIKVEKVEAPVQAPVPAVEEQGAA